jgi:hypothetical protein
VYMTTLPGITLEELATEYDQHLETWGGATRDLRFRLEGETPVVQVGGAEVPVTESGLKSVASFLDIPPKFLLRQDPDIQQHLLETLSNRSEKQDVTVYFREGGVQEVRKAGETRLRPHRLLEAAMKTFPGNSPIVEHWNHPEDLRVDVIFPEDFERGIGGDPQAPGVPGVGDITRGGVRIGQDRKMNTAPWIQPFLYRLVCTNGMELPDEGIKIEARGAQEREIEALFEAEIARAVDRLETDIQAFYDLRNTTLGTDPTGALHRAANEQNLPLRTVGRMEDLVPALLNDTEDGAEITMFDIVNLMTNQANDPRLTSNRSGRRNLQRAGGVLVNDHSERCGTCHSRLGR